MGSVTQWLGKLKAGDETALTRLVHRYWGYLVALARKKLGGVPRGAADEQDVAQSALWSFYRGAKENRFPRLNNRGDLIGVLTIITARKAARHIERQAAQKRGGAGKGKSGRSIGPAADSHVTWNRQPVASNSDPAERLADIDLCEYFLQALPKVLRPFAELYLAGWTHAEVAEACGCGLRTAQRRQAMIARLWRELPHWELD